LIATVVATVMAVVSGLVGVGAMASPADGYTGTHFGLGNLPPGCELDTPERSTNVCHHMRTDMNALDSPEVDVLLMVPVSPRAEQDMRIMRQAVEMWEGGIDYLAPQMGLDWLGKGMNFHVTLDYVDTSGGNNGGEFTTYPIADPEIVVIASNFDPVLNFGIGIDPVDTATDLGQVVGLPVNHDMVPCHGLQNPFDFDTWENLPGFDHHHEGRTGTYTEDCGGAGGNICFAVNQGADPAPEVTSFASFFDLVAHEFGHCLTVGHVGDGAENPKWGKVPTNDIMSYNTDPVGLVKCVSTLDVEGIAVSQSRYLDANGDGLVTPADKVNANQAPGSWNGAEPFMAQHPRDHFYASSTGAPTDCPQPDVATVPGAPRTDWTPEPATTSSNEINVTAPVTGEAHDNGQYTVTGTVERVPIKEPDPTDTTAVYDDADGDGRTPFTDIDRFSVTATPTTVETAISVASLPPTGSDALSATSYSVIINGYEFDSYVYPVGPPSTWDPQASAYQEDSFSDWDVAANTVRFHIPRDYLEAANVSAPYFVSTTANTGGVGGRMVDDRAPEGNGTIGIAGSMNLGVAMPAVLASQAETKTFGTPQHNHFDVYESSPTPFDDTKLVTGETSHFYSLEVDEVSDIVFTLDWTDESGQSDLDLQVTGAATSADAAASSSRPETFSASGVFGHLDLEVIPYLIDPGGADYTLTAVITPTGAAPVDTDGDGVPDVNDACPAIAGTASNGCPDETAVNEHVRVYVDNANEAAGTQGVDTSAGPAAFSIPVDAGAGTHTLRVEWEYFGKVIATKTITVGPAFATTTSSTTTSTTIAAKHKPHKPHSK
jgi:hypothetical protein